MGIQSNIADDFEVHLFRFFFMYPFMFQIEYRMVAIDTIIIYTYILDQHEKVSEVIRARTPDLVTVRQTPYYTRLKFAGCTLGDISDPVSSESASTKESTRIELVLSVCPCVRVSVSCSLSLKADETWHTFFLLLHVVYNLERAGSNRYIV